ncbi:hypothetical protein M0R45_015417 [Rubus argutus]|uniref:Uncharacterized protein n=1 Tax=Rubus argutus TaxID=59490 RepID=A0AAW1XQ16_RUBAR
MSLLMGLSMVIQCVRLLLFVVFINNVQAQRKTFNVKQYGAAADGKTDNSKAFSDAWNQACQNNGGGVVLFQKGVYLVTPVILQGHCKGRMELQIQGTLLASKEFEYSVGIDHWILFQYVDNLVISGGGSLDGQGASAWPYNDCLKNSRCKALPGSLKFDFVNNIRINYITFINSKNTNINLFHGMIAYLSFLNRATSTSLIFTVDLAMESASEAFPVDNPIVIDQQYCTGIGCSAPKTSEIQIADVKYNDIWGTSNTKIAVTLKCSQNKPCENIELRDINLSYNGGPAIASCSNAKGVAYGTKSSFLPTEIIFLVAMALIRAVNELCWLYRSEGFRVLVTGGRLLFLSFDQETQLIELSRRSCRSFISNFRIINSSATNQSRLKLSRGLVEVYPAIMFGSQASRIGVVILKQLSRGKSISRPRYATSSFSQFLQPLYDQQSVTKLFRGTIFQKHHHFSTTTASSLDEGIEEKEKISVTFVDKDGEEQHIKVPIGMSMLEAAHENDIELEGKDMEYYNKLEDPTDEENDMLDLAFGLTETSRLGCQVIASPELDGVRLAIPAATRNFAVDGYVPKPH